MQTVMTALIERIRAQSDTSIVPLTDYEKILGFSAILSDAEEMIKQEREQIENAFVAGYNTPAVKEDTSEYFAATGYYIQVYLGEKIKLKMDFGDGWVDLNVQDPGTYFL